jgi:hypothetical protein
MRRTLYAQDRRSQKEIVHFYCYTCKDYELKVGTIEARSADSASGKRCEKLANETDATIRSVSREAE